MKKYIYKKIRVTQETPKEVLDLYKKNITYCLETGLLYNNKTGTTYTNTGTKGYLNAIAIRFDNDEYVFSPHRLIWFLVHNKILPPIIQLDHINGVKTDNRLINLRECSNRENQQNSGRKPVNKYKGVIKEYYKDNLNYIAYISIGGKGTKIARFRCEETASYFYDAACRFYFKEFARPNHQKVYIPPQDISSLRILNKTLKLKNGNSSNDFRKIR